MPGTASAPPAGGDRAGRWSRWLLLAALAAGAVLRLLPDLFDVPPLQHDAREYDEAARQILQTGKYANTFREPLFPYFLALSYRLLGDDLLTQLRFLGLLSVLSMLVAVRVMRQTLPARAAPAIAAVAALWAVDGDQLEALRELYSVALQGLLLIAAVACLLAGVRRRSAAWCAGAGLLIGLLGLSRGAWAALSLPAAACALQGQGPGRLRRAAAVPLCTALLVVPWMVRQQHVHGFFAPAASSGMHLFIRTWHLYPEGEAGPAVRAIAAAHRDLFPDKHGQSLSLQLEWIAYAELKAAGMPAGEIDRAFMAVARECILARPLAYAKETLSMLTHVLGGYDFTWLSASYRQAMWRPLEEHVARGAWPVVAAEIFFRTLLPSVALAALAGGLIVCLRRREAARVTLLVLAGVVVAMLALVGSSPGVRRYRSELDVVILPAIAVGAWSIGESIAQRRAARR